jgi:hypothetical protein
MPVEYTADTTPNIFDIFGQLSMQVTGDPYQFSTTNLDNKVLYIVDTSRVGNLVWNFEISLPNYFPNQNEPMDYQLYFSFQSSTSFPSQFQNNGNATLVITGWQYGD